jgi:hypothetical protein
MCSRSLSPTMNKVFAKNFGVWTIKPFFEWTTLESNTPKSNPHHIRQQRRQRPIFLPNPKKGSINSDSNESSPPP